MSEEDKTNVTGICTFMFGLAVLVGIIMGIKWYKAGVQYDIYQRQHIEITQWECFLGLQPAEKVIQIKDVK